MKSVTIFVVLLCTVFALLASDLKAASEATTLDDGNLLFFISNNGTFGFDISLTRGEYSGLYYPKNQVKWVMSGGGIWVSGKVDGDWRVTISGDLSEFAPGPASIKYDRFNPFLIYKITKGENGALVDDYRNWPSYYGAPLNAFGNPLMEGSQSVFALFNDLDTNEHGFSISNTLPLGVEVKLFAYTFDNVYQSYDSMMTQAIILEYTISNVSDHAIDSCIVTLYADPDIGYGGNDLIGCDTTLGAAYCYDESDRDVYYGPMPPVVGMFLLGREPQSFNYYRSFFRSEPSSVKLDTLPKTVNLVKGLKLLGGPYINPTTNRATRFPFSGNPATDSGWICEESEDYRIVLNTEPISLKAGESTYLTAAILVAAGTTTHEGVLRFLSEAGVVKGIYESDTSKPRIEILDTGSGDTLVLSEPNEGSETFGMIAIQNSTRFTQEVVLVSPAPFKFKALPSIFDLGVGETREVQVAYSDLDSGEIAGTLDVYSYGLRTDKQSIAILVDRSRELLPGDANSDKAINLTDVLRMVDILYRGGTSIVPKRGLDSNCDLIFDLRDLVTLLNYLYQQVALPCSN